MQLLMSAGATTFTGAHSFYSIEVPNFKSLVESNGSIRKAIKNLKKDFPQQVKFTIWDFDHNKIATLEVFEQEQQYHPGTKSRMEQLYVYTELTPAPEDNPQ